MGVEHFAVRWGMGQTSAGLINFPPLALWKETFHVPGLEISLPAPSVRLSWNSSILWHANSCCWNMNVTEKESSFCKLVYRSFHDSWLLFYKQSELAYYEKRNNPDQEGMLPSHVSISCAYDFSGFMLPIWSGCIMCVECGGRLRRATLYPPHLNFWCVNNNHQQSARQDHPPKAFEVNKMIEPFRKYIRLNPTTWMASRNWARRCSIHKLLFLFFFFREHVCSRGYRWQEWLDFPFLPMLQTPLLSCSSCWQLYCSCVELL